MAKRFNITIEGDYDFDVATLWPDGDAPENPTAADVYQLIRDEGGLARVIHDWNLDDDLMVYVREVS